LSLIKNIVYKLRLAAVPDTDFAFYVKNVHNVKDIQRDDSGAPSITGYKRF